MNFRLLIITTGFLALVLTMITQPACAQNEFFRESSRALQDGNRLLAVDLMRKGFEQMPEMQGMMPQFLPLISDYTPTTPYSETIVAPVQNEEYVERLKSEAGQLERMNAIEAIVEMARDRQIVIINEAHDSPQHRAFGLLLALELRKIGFEFMAMETLSGPLGMSGPLKFDYPTLSTGHYSDEPVFGDFVRQTAQAGYQMIAYEIEPAQQKTNAQQDPMASIMERENAQSDNLIKHVLDKHKDARLFIFVGYSHATENWETMDDGSELGWMAAQLNRKTGIDPLTIDQAGGSYNPKRDRIDPVFGLVESQSAISQPLVLKDNQGTWICSDGYYNKTDLTVFHPVQRMVDGRPDWLRMNGYRKPAIVENKGLFREVPTLVQAFLESEGDDALPVDQLLIESDAGSSTFLLPPGNYRTSIRTIDGSVEPGPAIQVDQAN